MNPVQTTHIIRIAAAAIFALASSGCGSDSGDNAAATAITSPIITLAATLTGGQEVPAVTTTASGTGTLTLDVSAKTISGSVTTTGIAGVATHIHDGDIGVSGPVVVPLAETTAGSGVWTVVAGTTVTDAQIARLQAGGYYFNVHTVENPNGEIRGQIFSFSNTIQLVFTGFCTACHFSGGSASLLNLSTGNSYANLVSKPAVFSAGTRVIPGDSTNSVLYNRIIGNGLALMPQGGPALNSVSQNLIKLWIDTGAAND